MAVPAIVAVLGQSFLGHSLGELLRVLALRVLLTFLFYEALTFIIQIATHLFIGQDVISWLMQYVQGNAGGPIFTLDQAFQLLPAYALQLFFFMELDKAVSMVGATFSVILAMKLFGKAVKAL